MGALVAFEVALRFQAAGTPVAALFVSACAAPGHMGYEYLQGSDDDLLKAVADATGAKSEFLAEEKFAATFSRRCAGSGPSPATRVRPTRR